MSILLITPPFTQPNTPYPATAYLKGFLNTQELECYHADLSLEVTLQIFSKKGLKDVFSQLEDFPIPDEHYRTYILKEDYIGTIDNVISFLQGKNETLAHNICNGNFLPQSNRFDNLQELDWAFGMLGIQDKAKHLATLYLEDLIDLISNTIDEHFGFSRYAERLSRTLTDFSPVHEALQTENTFTDNYLVEALDKHINKQNPSVIGITIPFPGNLYGALRCGKHIKDNYPTIKVFMGGGYVNTELRSLSDERVFEYTDFITLDDGELPITQLIKYTEDNTSPLKRTFLLQDNKVTYVDTCEEKDVPLIATGTPDFTGLRLDDYVSVLEVVNPMHRLWSDGRWNKLTLAHGCYWGKCTFCDISLDYISRYEPLSASVLCDKMEKMIEETGQSGFHFVDEAAPPALLRDLSLEILKRNLAVTWWTNIRFESNFTEDVCKLMRKAGCIAVTGGLEVASDRLLKLMEKGVTVEQVATVAYFFSQNDIMVHAYLMYGFPTQTAQETIDSLEYVRQMFMNGVMQSGFWHQLAMTAHSPIGLDPEKFNVKHTGPEMGTFANNDYYHEDPEGCKHEDFSEGLKVALYNYMHGICFENHLSEWFEIDVPETTIHYNHIYDVLEQQKKKKLKPHNRLVWTEKLPLVEYTEKKKKGKVIKMATLTFITKTNVLELSCEATMADWLINLLEDTSIHNTNKILWKDIEASFVESVGTIDKLTTSHVWHTLRDAGLYAL